MRPRRAINRLRLGPVVGHTDETTSKIWIQVRDDPADYELRVAGAGVFAFARTEKNGVLEFRTGLAQATGLRPDWRYTYSIARRGRRVPGAKGTFRTMPGAGSMAPIVFCAISCNTLDTEGQWPALAKYLRDGQPSFLLLMGDQVYIDEDQPRVFTFPNKMDRADRRGAIAEKYRLSWSREVVREVLANIPTYMVWDDHDNRDGWGSVASDSPTLVARHPRGAAMFADVTGHFEDCRDAYWHFQACRNPTADDPVLHFPNYIAAPPAPGQRQAMPFAFRCGRVAVVVIESRGERDVFRKDFPILGERQWQFIDEVFTTLAEDIDALAVVTPTPIASMDPDGAVQKLKGQRTDDVEAFKRGNEKGVLSPPSSEDFDQLVLASIGRRLTDFSGVPVNLGIFKLSNIDEARDQWSHHISRPEQAALLKKANLSRFINRPPGAPRELIFLAGDVHIGCIHDITFSKPGYNATALTSSGISAKSDSRAVLGIYVDEDFNVADGIHSKLRDAVADFNFGVVEVLPSPDGAIIHAALVHRGSALTYGADVSDLV